jgi:hypothetical protein
MLQLSVEQITNIGIDIVVDPKKLSCSICCNLIIDARECLNKKCKKLFCNNCILSLKGDKNNIGLIHLKNKIPCPFCRVEADFSKAEETINQKISNFYFYNPDNISNKKYSLSEIKEIYSYKKNLNCCYKCKDSNFVFYAKCYSCNNNYCSDCNLIRNCLSCEMSVCDLCISNKFKNKENFICDFCEPFCKTCENENKKNEAKDICEICFKFICNECTEKCEICDIVHCKEKFKCISNCEHNIEKEEDENNIVNEKDICKHKIIINCKQCFKKCEYKDIDYHRINEKYGKSNLDIYLFSHLY